MFEQLNYYLSGQAKSWPSYILEQVVLGSLSWVPGIGGLGLRALAYRLIMNLKGMAAIEAGVRIVYASHITLGKRVYLDHGVYLHALPAGITIGDDTFIMHHTALHVFNFRDLPRARITIGKNCFIGEFNVIRGQGGVTIGDGVYTGPMVQIMAVNHVYDDPARPIREQGITAQGIVLEDDVWIGASAVILDGVTIGRGSVIGAGSVVTGNIPPYSIAVGTPARPVKDRRQKSDKRLSEAEIFYGKLEKIRDGK